MLFLLGRLHLREEEDLKTNKVKELLLQKGIVTNIDVLINYLFSDNPDILIAKKYFQIYMQRDRKKQTLHPQVQNLYH